MNPVPGNSDESRSWDTTFHVRRAANGDTDSLGSVVARLSPVLLAAAEYRLGPKLRTQVEAEDLVNEAWLVTLPKLNALEERDGRLTPVLLKFLTTTINFRINNLLRRRLRRCTTEPVDREAIAAVPSDASGAITHAVRHETQSMVRECLDDLRTGDREIILLRGIEQNSSKTVAMLLGLTVAAVDQRYSRALKRLRERLPESVFAELDGPDAAGA